MPNVLIVGYPKSGTTYISRLVADLIHAPLIGYWGSTHKEVASTGIDRDSDIQCYKAHQLFSDLELNAGDKLIYVVRDPRAVCLSAAHFFYQPLIKSKGPLAKVLNKCHWILKGKALSMKRSADAVMKGDRKIHENMSTSWSEHYGSYKGKDALVLRYEDVIDSPQRACDLILDHLNLEVSYNAVEEAIKSSSFNSMKAEFTAKGDKQALYHLRKAEKEEWKSALPLALQHDILEKCKTEMKSLGYY